MRPRLCRRLWAAGVGLYGFTKPTKMSGLVPLEGILARPVRDLKGDERNIAVLARAYHGASINAVRNGKGQFVETEESRKHGKH